MMILVFVTAAATASHHSWKWKIPFQHQVHQDFPHCHITCNDPPAWFGPIRVISKRNRIISTVRFLLHDGRHDRKPGRWDFGWCKLLFIVIIPQCITLNHHLTDDFIVVCISVLLGWMLIRFGGGHIALQDATCNNQLRWDRIWMDRAMNTQE